MYAIESDKECERESRENKYWMSSTSVINRKTIPILFLFM